MSQGGDKSGPGSRRGAGTCTSEKAGENSSVVFGWRKLCVRLAQAAHLALSSAELTAVKISINTQ